MGFFGYAGNYFAMKGVHDVAANVVLENTNDEVFNEEEASFDLIWDDTVAKWKVVLSAEVVFNVLKDDVIEEVRVNSGTNSVPSDIGDNVDEYVEKHLGTGSLPTETADRDGTYTLESLEMYLD